jgi:hypothetical protein
MILKTKSERAFSVNLTAEGNIGEVFFGGQRWNGYPGNSTVTDDLRGRIFSSVDAETVLTESGKGKLVFEKRWKDCGFVLREIWMVFDDCISWRIEVVLNPGCPERSIQIKQLFPYPYPAYKLHAWSASERFPCPLEDLGGLHLYYGDACYGTVIPAVSIYDENKDVGFTLTKPFGLKNARLAFHFKDYHSDGLEVENTCLYLGGEKPAVAGLLIHAHAGCWRPGLGWLYKKYPDYFNPPNPRVHELEGGFMITNPYTENAYLKTVAKYKVKWAEVHNHFPAYGNYAPEEKEWDSVIKHDYPDLPAPEEKLSEGKINHHIESLHANGVKALLYFQCTGDAFIPYAEKYLPDSIARDCAGKLIPTWKECCFVNASAGTSFNKHINKQIDKFIADYPTIDGVFLDQVCYQALDTAHTDGVTAYNNKAAAMFGHSYEDNLHKLAEILHKQNKVIWGNGPFNIEVQKNIDGIMAEGVSELSNTYKYLCLAKPLLVHTYPDTPEKVEKMFRHCLLSGASYSIGASSTLPVPPAISGKVQEIFDMCIPLAEKLFGRKWVFAPAPLQLPERYEGNIFYAKQGDAVLIPLVSKFDSLVNSSRNVDRDIEIRVNLEKLVSVSKVELLSCHKKGALAAGYKKTDKGIQIKLPEHSVMSVIIIKQK